MARFSSTNQPVKRRGKTKPIKDLVEAIGKSEPGAKLSKALEGVLGFKPKSFDQAHAMALYKRAILDGDIKASELLLKIQKQFPRDEIDLTTGGRPIDTKFQIEIVRSREDVEHREEK